MIRIKIENFNSLQLKSLMDVLEEEGLKNYSVRCDLLKGQDGEVVLDFKGVRLDNEDSIRFFIKKVFLPRILA